MEAIIDLFYSISTIVFSLFKDITEEVIDKNIEYLKQHTWFQDLLHNESYNNLITHHPDVRKVIGSINVKKMSKLGYNQRQQKEDKERAWEVQLSNGE